MLEACCCTQRLGRLTSFKQTSNVSKYVDEHISCLLPSCSGFLPNHPVVQAVASHDVQWLLYFKLACTCQQLQRSRKAQAAAGKHRQQQQQQQPYEQLLTALGLPADVQYSRYYDFKTDRSDVLVLMTAVWSQIDASSFRRQLIKVGGDNAAAPAAAAAAPLATKRCQSSCSCSCFSSRQMTGTLPQSQKAAAADEHRHQQQQQWLLLLLLLCFCSSGPRWQQ
jgi:hypothetical protein